MILTIDVGNTNTVIIGYELGKKVINQRIETFKENVTERYVDVISGLELIQLEATIVSCVVPSIEMELVGALNEVLKQEVILLNANTVENFEIMLENRKDIGSDLIATALGAWYTYKQACIIIDAGSATKLSVIDGEGRFLGGSISPGIGISIDAMNQFIPHLPKVEMSVPSVATGRNTSDAINSGLILGHVEMIRGLSKRMKKELNKSARIILTGGYANIFKDECSDMEFAPDLLNQGLYLSFINGNVHRVELSNDD